MPALVPTLLTRLQAADAHFAGGRLRSALSAYEELRVQAEAGGEDELELVAHAMILRILLQRGDLDGAQAALRAAQALRSPLRLEGEARLQAAEARLGLAGQEGRDGLIRYHDWAVEHGHPGARRDAATLLAQHSEGEEQVAWIELALVGLESGEDPAAAGLLTELAIALDGLERPHEAHAAYERAWSSLGPEAPARERVGAAWAVGASAVRLEDWPLARERLEQAVELGEPEPDCGDLVALALADLGQVVEASGDVVEARRLLLRALDLGRANDLAEAAPERWGELVATARRLELDA